MPQPTVTYPDWPPQDVLPVISYSSEGDYIDCPRRWLYEKASGLCPPHMARGLFIEKALQPTTMLVGSVTDAIISDAFLNYHLTGERPDAYLGDIITLCSRHFRTRSQFTIDWTRAIRTNGNLPNPERIAPLEGIYREPKISKEEASVLIARSTQVIFNLLESPLYDRIMAVHHRSVFTQPRGVVNRKRVAIPWFWVTGDLAAYASYDLIVKAPDRWIIVDWKSGRRSIGEERAETQLNYYAGFVMKEFGVAADDIELVASWIGEGTDTSEFPVAPGFVRNREPLWREWRDRIREDMDAVGRDRSLLDERFPMVSDIFKCRSCKYHSCPGYERHKKVLAPTEKPAPPQAPR